MRILPLGSECYVNSALDISNLKQFKIYKSPFNGTRILNYTSRINPIKMFLSDFNVFMDNYCNSLNWQLVTDGEDIQAINWQLNLRRCHLIKNAPNYFSILDAVKSSMSSVDIYDKDIVYFVDLNDYIYFDYSVFQEFAELAKTFNMLFFIRSLNVNYSHCKDIISVIKQELGNRLIILNNIVDAKQQLVFAYNNMLKTKI